MACYILLLEPSAQSSGGIIAGVVIAVIIVASVVFIAFYCFRKQNKPHPSVEDSIVLNEGGTYYYSAQF